MKHAYIKKRFQRKSLGLIEKANEIADTYEAKGYTLTLRQMFYRLVAAAIVENSQDRYKSLGQLLSNARYAGLLSWTALEDRTRNVDAFQHWDSPQERIVSAAKSYRIDLWQDQPTYVEVWVEKQALADVCWQAAVPYDVPFLACRGFVSTSEIWRAAERFKGHQRQGQDNTLLYLGDHDPSGLDMPRDIGERFRILGASVEIRRIALNYEQVQQYNPPPNPAKEKDTRYKAYKAQYGRYSWELDALEPEVINQLITRNILSCLDLDLFNDTKSEQEAQRDELIELAANF